MSRTYEAVAGPVCFGFVLSLLALTLDFDGPRSKDWDRQEDDSLRRR
jgi:hypothetical protein